MKTYRCACGQRLFFGNTVCLSCTRELGFDPSSLTLLALEPDNGDLRMAGRGDGRRFKHCTNRIEHDACNWLLPADAGADLCRSCSLNETIPNLGGDGALERWRALEDAKRRLLYTLLRLGLPVEAMPDVEWPGMSFALLDDRLSNPDVLEETVVTGHQHGRITINAREADPAARETVRAGVNEQYRTLLGHVRHEAGHYYWFGLIDGTPWLDEFRDVFGDERAEYQDALERYYDHGPPAGWPSSFISGYAAAHPHEDWAESFAHLLHMHDTLETSVDFELADGAVLGEDFDARVGAWMELTVALNALNRSMGHADAYPFLLQPIVIEKLRFVEAVVSSRTAPMESRAARGAAS